jgi:hypothetical protein
MEMDKLRPSPYRDPYSPPTTPPPPPLFFFFFFWPRRPHYQGAGSDMFGPLPQGNSGEA